MQIKEGNLNHQCNCEITKISGTIIYGSHFLKFNKSTKRLCPSTKIFWRLLFAWSRHSFSIQFFYNSQRFGNKIQCFHIQNFRTRTVQIFLLLRVRLFGESLVANEQETAHFLVNGYKIFQSLALLKLSLREKVQSRHIISISPWNCSRGWNVNKKHKPRWIQLRCIFFIINLWKYIS